MSNGEEINMETCLQKIAALLMKLQVRSVTARQPANA